MRRFWSSCLLSALNSRRRTITCCLALLLISALGAAQEIASIASDGGADVKSAVVQPVAAAGLKLKLPEKYDITRIGDRGIGDGVNFYSREKERDLGESMARRFDTELQFLNDPEVNDYVNRVVQRLVIHSDAKMPFTVHVVKNEQVTAFSLPGGFLYVTTGLIAASPDEATFAGALAHEVAHVAARHVTRALTRKRLFGIASLPLVFLTGGAGAALNNAAGFGIPISGMKFARDSEREADLLGLEYTYAAGYDPHAFVQFLETMEAHQKQKLPGMLKLMFTSHVMTEDRIQRAQAEMASMLPEKPTYVIDSSEFQQAQARLFDLTDPCRYSNGKPVLLGSGKKCDAPKEKEEKPKLKKPW